MATRTEFQKHDSGKRLMHLVPHEALLRIADVVTHGAEKYGAYNWRLGTQWNRLYDAAMRHMMAWQLGEDDDPESGFSHLAHAACDLMMLLSMGIMDVGEDDRWRSE